MLLFSTDIDGTVYDSPDSAERFADFWTRVQESASPPILVYNTGRSLRDTLSLLRGTPLPDPDFVIAGVGTEIFDFARAEILEEWRGELSGGWDFHSVKETVLNRIEEIEPQPPECQNPFKCSWFWHDRSVADLDRVRTALLEAGIAAQVVYSSERDLDILPAKANKGNAVRWLSQWLGIPLNRVVVAGDSGNDASMFLLEGVSGILVANAEAALLNATRTANPTRATAACADGIIEVLQSVLEMSLTRDSSLS